MDLDLFGQPFKVPDDAADRPGFVVSNEPDDSPWPDDVFSEFAPMSFDMIMADPPWPYTTYSVAGQAKGAASHYRCCTMDKIARLPVGHLASRDCVLILWITTPLLLGIEDPSVSPVGRILKAWGFRYGTCLVWNKVTKNGKQRWGTGYLARSCAELAVIGIAGEPRHRGASSPNIFSGVARGHSVKPLSGYEWAEAYLPGARRIEIFSRMSRDGWEVWGDQTGTLDRCE
jgi:N6-adenosine-specific RNA methylase IME4